MDRLTISAMAGALLLGASPLAVAASNGSPAGSAAARSSSSAATVSEAQAKKEIQFDGYNQVQNLHKTRQGWEAKAMEGGKQVTILVDNQGVKKI